jgi:asparagine synthase (glutamine-hydrolysing)
MCGIAGLAGSSSDQAATIVERMVGALARRGPDGEGLHRFSEAVLGHRRLSIYDLSPAGRQPMLTEDGSIGITFNGSIFNFQALRRELEGLGYAFRSQTDTEVLLQGYRAWTIEGLLSRVRGMFAFALWDDTTRTLYLVRDRFGVKPLHYAETNGRLTFASTATALAHSLPVREVEPLAVADVFQLGFVKEERSIWSGCHKLLPGHVLTWHAGAATTRRYWSLPSTLVARTFESAVDETERLLVEATELRLKADVPVGTLLSGGIDSALVCWAARALGSNIQAFTVGARGSDADESTDAARTAREIGIRHEVVPGAALEPDDFLEHAAASGEPFPCSSALGMLLVSRAIRRAGLTVLLTGDGGDDVFLGYPRHRMLLCTSQVARVLPSAATTAWERARGALPAHGMGRRLRHLIDYTVGGLPAFLRGNDSLARLLGSGLGGSRLMAAAAHQGPSATPSMLHARRALEDYLAYDLRTQFVGEYLTKVDSTTMHYALESRSPFLDHQMWEFATTLPFDVRLRGGRLKAVLRALAKRRISKRVAGGRKRGFTVPVEQAGWPALRSLLPVNGHDWRTVQDGWVTSGIADEVRAANARGAASETLWRASVLELWLRRHAT